MEEIVTCFKKSFDYKGKASRKEFGYFWLLRIFIVIVSFLVSNLLAPFLAPAIINGVIYILWIQRVLTFIPFLAVSVRRLNDIGRSVWLILIIVVPVILLVINFSLIIRYYPGYWTPEWFTRVTALITLLYIFFKFIAFVFDIYLVSARSKGVCYASAQGAPRKE